MNERILLVGEDPVLMATRAMLLSDWQTTTLNAREASAALSAQSFDLVVLCQTVPDADVKQLIATAQRKQPSAAILAISRGVRSYLGVRTENLNLGKGPEWLRKRVAEMLAERARA
jgi:DNA-binding response OmpR family regulator